MSVSEIIFFAVSTSQPLCVGLLAYLGFFRTLARSGLSSVIAARRERLTAFRFYECATYSRLSSSFTYPLSFITVLCSYLVYDVDLSLFLCEVLLVTDAGAAEFVIFTALTVFTILGLTYDYKLGGYG